MGGGAGIRSIPLYKAHVPPGIGEELEPLFASGQLSGGPAVEAFQASLGDFLGNRQLLLTGDVSSSISLALMLAGVGPEDEVVLSPMVCLATSCPVANQHARVRWCDVDPWTGNLDPADLERCLTPRTKAILVYHWAGNPAEMDPILDIARAHGLAVIEDAGEAIGAEYKGRRLGAVGADFSVFSFYPNRHITTIEGGAISFSHAEAWERGRWLRRYGMHQPTFRSADGEINSDSDIRQAGLNTYMNQVSASIGLKQMARLPGVLEQHRANASRYDALFAGLQAVRPLRVLPEARSSYWVYTILAEQRDQLMSHLKAQGINCSKVHLRNDLYSCFGPSEVGLPGVDDFSRMTLSLPCGWWVCEEEVGYIYGKIAEFYRNN